MAPGSRFACKIASTLAFLFIFVQVQSVPAQVNSTWNFTTGNWSDATRWDTNPLFPNNGNGGNNYNASIGGGTVNVDIPIVIENLTFNAGTIIRTNDLTVNASFDSTGNLAVNLTGTGALKLFGGGNLQNLLTSSGGTIVFGDGVNSSTFNHTNTARLRLDNLAQASVANGSTYEINVTSSGSVFDAFGGVGTFTVETGGVLRKMGSATHVIYNVALNNNGTIAVDQGNLEILGTATSTNRGLITIAAGSTITKGLGADTLILAAGSSITGDGTLIQRTGALDATGDNSISRLQMDGGSFNRSAGTTTTITNDFTWNFSGSLTGSGRLQVDGGGTINRALTVDGGTIVFGDGVNSSTLNHTNTARLSLNNAAQASVANGSTYDINVTSPGSFFDAFGGAGTFTVETGGVLRKLGSATHIIANVALNNNGTIAVDQGNLEILGTATSTNRGLITIAAGSTITKGLGADTLILAAGSSITGDGTLIQRTGTLDATGDNSISRLQMDGGSFNRSAGTTTTITNDLTWNIPRLIFGSLTGSGRLQVDGGGTINGRLTVDGGTIVFGEGVNSSTLNHTNNALLQLNNAAQASVANASTYEINVTSPGSSFERGTFTVETGGVLRKLGSATHIIAGVALDNNGTIELNQGSLEFFGGSLNNSGSVLVNAGVLSFNFGASFATNNGVVTLAPGALLQGSVTNGPTGLLNGAGAVSGFVSNQAGGQIAAGVNETFTTLSLQNGLSMSEDSSYLVNLFDTDLAGISLLAVTGDADIAPGANIFLDLGMLTQAEMELLRTDIGVGNSRNYTVLTTTGAILGGGFGYADLSVISYGEFLPSEWNFDVLTNSDSVELVFQPVTAVPEPSSTMFVAAIGLIFACKRFRYRGNRL